MILSGLFTKWQHTSGRYATNRTSENNARQETSKTKNTNNPSYKSSVQNVFEKYGNKKINDTPLSYSPNYVDYIAFRANEHNNGNIVEKSYLEPEIKTKFKYSVEIDKEGKATNFICNSKATFSTDLTENVSDFDLLCALGETNNSRIEKQEDKSKIFTPKLREARNMKLIEQVDCENGLQYNVYEKGNTIVLAINGLNDSKDVRMGAHVTMLNHKVFKLTGIGLVADDIQVKEMEKVYKKYRQLCRENGKQLIVAGYSVGGAIARFVAMNNEDDKETRFVSFNALGTGNIEGRIIQNYCISEDNRSSGDWLFPAFPGTRTFNSNNNNKHNLEAFLNT